MKFIYIFLMMGSCGLVGGIIIEYMYYPNGASWGNAQQYCRQYYTDLPTFNSTEELQQLMEIFPNNYGAIWIGLNRQGQNEWQWSNGQPAVFFQWYPGYPLSNYYDKHNNYVSYDCTILFFGQWQNVNCQNGYSFYCYTHLILVNEKKTWEEALQFCTTNYTGLAHLPDATQVLQAQKEIALAQTVNVWAGLRFIDGIWFWMNGLSVENPDLLPPCPAQPYHCGAFNSTTNFLQNRDCSEKLNFLCYK